MKLSVWPALVGRLGEYHAFRFLKRRGYEIWARNWRCSHGEIDLIARLERCMVFVEVKARQESVAARFAPHEAVAQEKQERIIRLAHRFVRRSGPRLRQHKIRSFRFDVIGVYMPKSLLGTLCSTLFGGVRIEHFQAAFIDEGETRQPATGYRRSISFD